MLGIIDTLPLMNLTVAQVLSLAPDASAAAAGKKLASAKNWQTLGNRSRPSGVSVRAAPLYQVRCLGQVAHKLHLPKPQLPASMFWFMAPRR